MVCSATICAIYSAPGFEMTSRCAIYMVYFGYNLHSAAKSCYRFFVKACSSPKRDTSHKSGKGVAFAASVDGTTPIYGFRDAIYYDRNGPPLVDGTSQILSHPFSHWSS